MSNNPESLVVAYVPVIHAGYIDFFQKYSGTDMNVLDQDVLDDYSHLRKDIRALQPQQARDIVESLNIFRTVNLLGKSALEGMSLSEDTTVTMPDDEIGRDLMQRYFHNNTAILEPVFLRWDRENSFVNKEVAPDRRVHANELDDSLIKSLYMAAERSSDWWRRVGAALVTPDGDVIDIAHNHHLPTAYTPWVDGDPRNNAYRGVATEASTIIHAEADLIARAARLGEGIEGASMYVTTFPCPSCAKLIAEAGISSCYYTEGYAMTDGQRVLSESGVEIVAVDGVEPAQTSSDSRPYPSKYS